MATLGALTLGADFLTHAALPGIKRIGLSAFRTIAGIIVISNFDFLEGLTAFLSCLVTYLKAADGVAMTVEVVFDKFLAHGVG